MIQPTECLQETDLSYLIGFKPGDRIFIEPVPGNAHGNYQIANNWALKNEKTGRQASATIPHSNKEFATYDEMNQTHGIRGFIWRPV